MTVDNNTLTYLNFFSFLEMQEKKSLDLWKTSRTNSGIFTN